MTKKQTQKNIDLKFLDDPHGLIPYKQYNELDVDQIDGHCLNLLRIWMKHTKQDIQMVKKLLAKLSVCWFYRIISNKNDSLNGSCVSYLSSRFRSSNADEFVNRDIYGIFCVEDNRDKKLNASNFHQTKIYFMGYIREDSAAVSLGTIIPYGTVIYNHTLTEDNIIIQFKYLTTNMERVIESNDDDISNYIGMSSLEISADDTSNDNATKDTTNNNNKSKQKPTGITIKKLNDNSDNDHNKDEMSVTMRDQPSIWIYIYHWDPPTMSNHDVRYISSMPFEHNVMKRLETLCYVYKGAYIGEGTASDFQMGLLPIDKRYDMIRDRICIHFLTAAMSCDEELMDWYIIAESMMLENNLKSLSDIEDRLITLQINDIDIRNITKSGEVSVWNSFETKMCELQQNRMRTAMIYAKPSVMALTKNNKKGLQSPEESQENQMILDLIQRCRQYVSEKVTFEKESHNEQIDNNDEQTDNNDEEESEYYDN